MTELEIPQPNEPVSEGELRTLAAFLFNLIEAQITRADTKAGLVIAADAVLITVSLLLTRRGAIIIIFDPTTSLLDTLMSFFTVCMFGALFLSMLTALVATRPSLRVKGGGETLFFFGRIAQYTHSEFLKVFSEQSVAQHHASLLTEVYNTARIASNKFKLVRYSIDGLLVALFFWACIVIEIALTF